MTAYLTIIAGLDERTTVELQPGRWIVGRAKEASIQIPSEQISRQHAELVVTEQGTTLVDLGSANGTLINGQRISTQHLNHGDQISLGDVAMVFFQEGGRPQGPSGPKPKNTTFVQAATEVLSGKTQQKSLFILLFACFGASMMGSLYVLNAISEKIHQTEQKALALDHARSLVRLLALENKAQLKMDNRLLLNIENIKKAPGVQAAWILDAKGKVLAPLGEGGKLEDDPRILNLLDSPVGHDDLEPLPKAGGRYTLVHPIRTYVETLGKYKTIGIAKLEFAPTAAAKVHKVASNEKSLVTFLALFLAFLGAFYLRKWISRPLLKLAEALHGWRLGHHYQPPEQSFKEWAELYEAIDRATREKTSG